MSTSCLSLVALFALAGAPALAQVSAPAVLITPAPDSVIDACVSKFEGFARIVKGPQECAPGWERFVQWNVQGVAGAMGAAGPQGVQGLVGAPGLAGATGPAGAVGPVGAKGVAGATGAAGTNGVAGPPGLPGAQGAAGAAGTQGLPGMGGPPGGAGAKGDAGVAGPTGPTGATGAVGAQGPAGSGGSVPANLTALSAQLSPDGVAALGNTRFRYQADCQLGDIVLSVNGYGSGALPADGRILPINTNTAVFSLLGTTFGGNGTTTFGLPDLRAFAPKGLQYSICVAGIFPAEN